MPGKNIIAIFIFFIFSIIAGAILLVFLTSSSKCGDDICDLGERGEGVCPQDCPLFEESPKPDFCSQIFEPVCGQDRRTYSNECVIRQKGIKIAYKGECQEESKEKTSSGCIYEHGSCCRDSLCQFVNINCQLGTRPEIKGCDENCEVIFGCVPDS